MGRDLALQLAASGATVACTDINGDGARAVAAECGNGSTGYATDVADRAAMDALAAEVASDHQTKAIHLLFNNAGIGGAGSFVTDEAAGWERTFNVCWGGVYNGCRAFLPMLLAAEEAWIINTSSVNGFWASLGPMTSHTAYSAAKFAVKGFSEALVTDLRLNAPHVGVSVVMPGHIGTDIVANSNAVHGRTADAETLEAAAMFRNSALTSSPDAAAIILDGVRKGQWRILVGDDAVLLDAAVRDDPWGAYEPGFVEQMRGEGALGFTE